MVLIDQEIQALKALFDKSLQELPSDGPVCPLPAKSYMLDIQDRIWWVRFANATSGKYRASTVNEFVVKNINALKHGGSNGRQSHAG